MASFISETSNYLFVGIILFYVITNFIVFFFKNPEEHKHFYAFQFIIAVLFHAVGYITLFMRSEDLKYFFFFAFQEIIMIAIVMIYLTIYPSISRLLLNNMIFLLDVSFIILGRLAFENALRQFSITIVLLVVSLFVPVIYIKNKGWRNAPYLYCAVGIIALAAVWITGSVTHGSKLNIDLWGFNFQPSEFVKISIVFFMASLLSQKKNKMRYVLCILFMMVHVMILVLSRDLGSAGIYLITLILEFHTVTFLPLYLFLKEIQLKKDKLLVQLVRRMFMVLLTIPIKTKMEIPLIGATTGCHLHFTIKLNGTPVNPLNYYEIN